MAMTISEFEWFHDRLPRAWQEDADARKRAQKSKG